MKMKKLENLVKFFAYIQIALSLINIIINKIIPIFYLWLPIIVALFIFSYIQFVKFSNYIKPIYLYRAALIIGVLISLQLLIQLIIFVTTKQLSLPIFYFIFGEIFCFLIVLLLSLKIKKNHDK